MKIQNVRDVKMRLNRIIKELPKQARSRSPKTAGHALRCCQSPRKPTWRRWRSPTTSVLAHVRCRHRAWRKRGMDRSAGVIRFIAAASNSWIVRFDNLSHLPDELADAACRLATGGGFGGRELYSDHDQAVVRRDTANGVQCDSRHSVPRGPTFSIAQWSLILDLSPSASRRGTVLA